jgi:hypothetical protein
MRILCEVFFMRKSLLCGFLALVMLLGCFVAVPTASAATDGRQDADYAALYVGDGLVRRFDAYDPNNGTVDLTNGRWYSTDRAVYATLGQKSLWKKQTQGIGYAMTSHSQWSSNLGQAGLDLGISNLPTGDFTVEYVMTLDGLVDASGNDVPHTTAASLCRYY